MTLRFNTPRSINGWTAIDDRIMGGVSASTFRHDPAGHAEFSGIVSPDNGGGFASVRHPTLSLGDAHTQAYRLEVLGDGKRYKLNLRTDQTFDGVNYQASFAPPAGQWTTLFLPLAAFEPRFRGRLVQAPPLAPDRVSQVGLMIGDKQWGEFRLLLRLIASIGGE